MKVLIGCEESQAVCIAFRELGHEAYSCDIQECSGGHPEWHMQEDIFKVINSENWDALIGFPPCTYLTNAGIGYFNEERYGDKAKIRKENRLEAAEFFLSLYNCNIPFIALENPVGWMNSSFRKPNQILQPYYFGDPHVKNICLWLKGLPNIKHNKGVKPEPLEIQYRKPSKYYKGGEEKKRYFTDTGSKSALRRSKTFPGIAKAMAEQWSEYISGEIYQQSLFP